MYYVKENVYVTNYVNEKMTENLCIHAVQIVKPDNVNMQVDRKERQ